MALTGTKQHRWWKEGVVYQIYPSTFKDTNGDGWGDVRGITSKLDYLKGLGVDIVWVSPIYKSPQADMGYDIADYKAIDPAYGSLQDVDDLIAELKKRDMKLMMDLVVNHTSDQHAWFLESRSSKSNPKRSWYIWKPARRSPTGELLPPNNWAQILGDANSAWTYDDITDEYYLSVFTPNQPDLNWENPDVRAAVHDVMHFWLKRGVCGYRMDVINMISKDPSFPDAPETLGPGHIYHPGERYFINGPRMHEYLRAMNKEVLSHYDAITVGEMPGISDVDEVLRSVGTTAGELNMIFIFDIVDIDQPVGGPKFAFRDWNVHDLRRIITKWQRAMIDKDGWNSLFVENHDNPRSVSRYTDDSDAHRVHGAKLLALMQSTLSGTLYVFQGEELGMRNVPKDWDIGTEYKDIESVNFWQKSKKLHANNPAALAHAREILTRKARDHARTPVPWTPGPNAGFSDEGVNPWMRVNSDYPTFNAESESKDPGSVLNFWKHCLKARKLHKEVFVYGDYTNVGTDRDEVFAYLRTAAAGRALVVLNFSGGEVGWDVPESMAVGKWIIGNYEGGAGELEGVGKIRLRPWEGVMGRCRE